MARVCVRFPNAVADPKLTVQLAERALSAKSNDPQYLGTLGAALYRAGQLDAAIQRLNAAVKSGATGREWLFLAMAHHRLGHAFEARMWLDRAAKWIDQATDEKLKGAATRLPWDQRLELQHLRREAEELLKTPEPKK